MALIKCPECGRETVSSRAKSCPGCGYNLKEYHKNIGNNNKWNDKTKIQILAGIIIGCVLLFGIYYFMTRCSYSGCNEKKMPDSEYCRYHSLEYESVQYNYAPKTGNARAVEKAESYTERMAFSYSGLVNQLEYEGFTTSEAEYGADNCKANWKEQALKKAKSCLESTAFSYSGLEEQLIYEGFTEDEAEYGADNCGADWKEQAAKKAKSYEESLSMSQSELIDQLMYEGFTAEQAIYGAGL